MVFAREGDTVTVASVKDVEDFSQKRGEEGTTDRVPHVAGSLQLL